MISDLDTYRSAKVLTDRHGDEATIFAAMNADAMLEKGDLDGAAAWRRIIQAIGELLRERLAHDEAVH